MYIIMYRITSQCDMVTMCVCGSVGRFFTSVIANCMTKTKRVTDVWYAYTVVISKVYNFVSLDYKVISSTSSVF